MKLRDIYDVPPTIADGMHSPAFCKFLRNWFGDTGALTHGELDTSFLQELSPDELVMARELIRRNLRLGYNHIIQATSALGDLEAAPILRKMLEAASDQSRRLVIAGALWNLVRDPIFIRCLEIAKGEGGSLLTGAHLYQVLWLDDERAVDFLIDLLDHRNSFVQVQSLGLLNTLELGRNLIDPAEMSHDADYYRERRPDVSFRRNMFQAVQKVNRQMKIGRAFGFVG